jgi:putative hemolysin
MSAITAEILVILLLVVLNGVFAMSEIAVISARKIRLQQWAKEGDKRARAALELAKAPSHFLSTVQIGITLVGILAGAFGGATLAEELAARLSHFSLLAPYSEAIGIGIVVLGITFLSVIIGELVPKQLALNNAERIASTVATPMRVLSLLASPVVRLLSGSTDVVLRVLRIAPSTEPPVTEEEIKVLLEQGSEAGVFEEAEHDMVKRVFRLSDQHVDALMTPRKEVVWLDVADSAEDIRRKLTDSVYSRFPVGQESLDNALGIVQAKDLLVWSLGGQPIDLRASLRPLLFVPESTPAPKVLELFKKSRTQIALVVDEYGVIQGLITLNDLLEAIVGNIPAVDEPTELPAVQRADGSWLLDGMLPIDTFKEIFRIGAMPGEERGYFQTLGGFVMMHTEQIPSAGQQFEWNGLRFEVLDMDLHRVDKVLVAPVQTTAPEPASHT